MVIEKLAEWPSPKTTKFLLIFGIILMIIVVPIMNYFYKLSNYPVTFVESQLSFSGAIIKSHFRTMNAEELNYYLIWVLVDYGFMFSFGSILFSLNLILARKFSEDSRWRKSGYIAAVLGALYFCCDAIENAFILAMLSDPYGFPDILAVVHSIIAVVKFCSNISSSILAILAILILLIKKK